MFGLFFAGWHGLQTALFDVQPKLSIHIGSTRSRLEAFDELCGSLGRHR
jgi:hypothetical protein